MPNPVPAAAEGLPKITRRNALGLMGALALPSASIADQVLTSPAIIVPTPEELIEFHLRAMAAVMNAALGSNTRIVAQWTHGVFLAATNQPRSFTRWGDRHSFAEDV
jgi:hypothetical protein